MKPTTVKRIINEIINDGKGVVTITIEMNNGRVFVTDFDKEPGTCSTIAWDDEADFETHLERIITQKWIAMYPDGCEGWAEFRRTGYPHLLPVVNNDSQGLIDTEIQVRRCPFPVQEYNTNQAAVQAAIQLLDSEAMGGGQDNGGTRLWWDRKAN